METPEIPAAAPALDAVTVVEEVASALDDLATEQARYSRGLMIALLFALALGLTVAAWYFARTAERTQLE